MDGPCPEENELAALVGRDPEDPASGSLLAHVASCEACRELLDLLDVAPPPSGEAGIEARPGACARPPLPRGSQIGRYVVLEPLGSGATGRVYAAYDPKLDRRVALKLLHPAAEAAETTQQRLEREAQALGRLSHPNVVSVHDVGAHEDQVYMATELVAGVTLADWAPPSWRAALSVLLQAGRGLAAAHAAGLIHRDFKLANVILGDDGRVRVVDFGLARLGGAGDAPADGAPAPPGEEDPVALTRSGSLLGTPAYMAPEQFAGRRADVRTDQFSFCVAAYELLYGRRPFSGATLRELVAAVRAGEVPQPRAGRVPGRLLRVLRRGLSRDPEARYPSMDALLADLAHHPLRWPLLSIGGAAAALLVALVAAGWLPRGAAAPCEGGARRLTGVWDEAVRGRVEAAFARTGAPFAADAYRGTAARLSAYGDGWVAVHREVCRATRVHGEQSDALLDLRMACLERRRQELAALTEVLVQADRSAVQQAVTAAQVLTPIEPCARETEPLAQRRPDDERQRAESTRLRPAIARVRALLDTGQFPRGQAEAAALVTEARRVGARAAEAEAGLHLGRLQERLGRRQEATRTLQDAALAAEAGGEDRLLAEVAAAMITLEYKRERYDDAEGWDRRAAGLIERIGGDALLDAARRYGLGWVRYARNDLDGAAREFAAALALRQRQLPPDDLRIARAHDGLTMIAQRRGERAESLRLYELRLRISERALGPQHPDLATPLYAVGTALFNLGRDDEALRHFRRAQVLLRQNVPADHPVLTDVTAAVGMVLAAQGRYDDAIASYREAMAPAERGSVRDLRLVGKLNLLCESLLALGRPAEALASARRSLAIAEEKLGPDHVDVSRSLYVLGRASAELSRGAEARAQLQRAADLIERKLGAGHPDLAEVLAALGTAERRAGRAEEAAAHLARALRIGETSGLRPQRLAEIRAAAGRPGPEAAAR